MKKCTSLFLALMLCLGLSVPASAAGPTFSDVPVNHWAYSYVENAASEGWVTGIGNGLFGVDDQISYAQMATMVTNAFYAEKLEVYTGSSAAWYSRFTGVADQEGLLNGTVVEGKDQDDVVVNQPVTRYDMAQIIYNIIVNKGISLDFDAAMIQTGIADWNKIPDNYCDAVMGANAAGIITGVDANGTFDGCSYMTRGQAAVVMTQVNNVVLGTEAGDGETLYEVTRVIDGDTIEINYNGTLETVRLIGVDTPESVHPDSSQNTKEGVLASDYTKAQLEGKMVAIELDVQQRDQYGRLLAYVWVDGIMYNKTLLEEGIADLATYPPNVKYVDEFTAIVEARNSQSEDPETPVKTSGNYVGSLESDKYHLPGCRFAENILPENEIWFDTVEEAQALGYEACGVCHPF